VIFVSFDPFFFSHSEIPPFILKETRADHVFFCEAYREFAIPPQTLLHQLLDGSSPW